MLIVIAIIFIAIYAFVVEPRWVRVRRHKILVPGLVEAIRFGFVSDFHNSLWAARAAAATFEREQLAGVLLGGDYLHRGKLPKEKTLQDFCHQLLSPILALDIPVFAVLGNHDLAGGGQPKDWRGVFERLGVTLLEDECIEIPPSAPRVQSIGLTELETNQHFSRDSNFENRQLFRQAVQEMGRLDVGSAKLPAIIVCHNPDGVWRKVRPKVHVVLAGHTHGGQIAGTSWLLELFSKPLRRLACPSGSFGFWCGQQRSNGRELIVSSGVGFCPRIGRRPEVHIIELVPNS